jgi:hypothetical protein
MYKVPEEFKKIYVYAEKTILHREIEDPGVDSFFLINTGLKSIATFKFNNSWSDPMFPLLEPGDLVLNRDTLYWGCEHWRSGHSVICHDYHLNNESWGHGAQMILEEAREDMYEAVAKDGWKIGGNGVFIGHRYEGWEKDIKPI